MTDLPYSGLFSREKIFANFTDQKRFVKILPSKYLLSIDDCENFPLEKLRIAQFVKIFPLENNPLYGTFVYHNEIREGWGKTGTGTVTGTGKQGVKPGRGPGHMV